MHDLINIICDIIKLCANASGLNRVELLKVVIINLQNVYEEVKKKEGE